MECVARAPICSRKSGFSAGLWRHPTITKREPWQSKILGENVAMFYFLWVQKKVLLHFLPPPPNIFWTWFAQLKIDPSLPTIKLPIIEGRDQLWGKTREAFRHIWNHYRDQADWFFKADDDTYEIPIIFALSKNSLNEISFAGTPFWKICAIFFRLTTHRNPCGLDTNSRPSLNKATLAVAQVTSQLK